MKNSGSKTVVYIVLLLLVTIGTIINKLIDSDEINCASSIVFTITLTLEILSMVYFIISDLVQNLKKIERYGSLSLFATVDRSSVSKAVYNSIKNNPQRHVIYVNCDGLEVTEIENIKQRLYEDFTDFRPKNYKLGSMLFIKSVFVPAVFDIEELNKSIFYNKTRCSKRKNLYIYDNKSANVFFIEQIAKKIDGIDKKKNKAVKNTYIIYLSPLCRKNSGGISVSVSSEDTANMIRSAYPEISEINGKINSLVEEYGSLINNVLVFDSVLRDETNKIFIKKSIDYAFVIYCLKTGNYIKGLEIIERCSYTELIKKGESGNDFVQDFCYKYLLADALHLLNCYEAAYIVMCSTIPKVDSTDADLINYCNNEKYKLMAHIAKHVGLFSGKVEPPREIMSDSSNELLGMIDASGQSLDTELKTVVNNYFESQMRQIEGKSNICSSVPKEEIVRRFETCESIDRRLYYPAFTARMNPNKALHFIDDILDYYITTGNRRRYNAYYIKAEILRIMNDYDAAYKFYIKASGMLDGHHDVNLLDQAYFSLKALELLGVVNGYASYHVWQYRNEFYTLNGFRRDYKQNVELIRKFLPDIESAPDENEPRLQFNETLLRYINSISLDKEHLKKLLAAHVFVIL